VYDVRSHIFTTVATRYVDDVTGNGFLWVSIFYLALGGGRFSVDYLISKKYNRMK